MSTPSQISALRRDVHAVVIGDDAVFLDVTRDRYACVPSAAGWMSLDAAQRVLGVADPAFAEELRQADLIADHATPRDLPDPIAVATISAVGVDFAPPGWRDGVRGLRATLDLAQAYHRRPLAKLVAWAAEGATPGGNDRPDARMLDLVESFHRWAPFAPAPGKCLLRSFMLLRLLRRHGHDARWVFGVRTWPFRAHCWLQRGDTVLDDDVEALVALTPIMVV
ncbi:MAG: lasso peptide biosynthesis B2 protein [Phenylobacterium sp.]|uniref:lasso peptide biosynthesis B2 protein n=1 Tax=Phenylobacterium sp. TaxID=1871053 RepID=UPI0011F469E9|nr:lasso peptide biosynthesis B2 protein [Phenylobacterium sp.]TAJ68724.1 MAG: lasso peptide biosynthesis B2 protein [Phenylobacterium sp.]